MVWMLEEDYTVANELLGAFSQVLQSNEFAATVLFKEAEIVGPVCAAGVKCLQEAIVARAKHEAAKKAKKAKKESAAKDKKKSKKDKKKPKKASK